MVSVTVLVKAKDLITRAGLVDFLRAEENIEAHSEGSAHYDVVCIVAEKFSTEVAADLSTLAAGNVPAILVVDEFSNADLEAVGTNIAAVLSRRRIVGDEFISVVLDAATSRHEAPDDRRRRLTEQIEGLNRPDVTGGDLQERNPDFTLRELEILRLMADGYNTTEIAANLHLSERSIKLAVYGMTSRLNLRNRSHAVARALRIGAI